MIVFTVTKQRYAREKGKFLKARIESAVSL